MNNFTDAQDLRTTATSQWNTIRSYYSDDNTALGLIADFIQHPSSPATELKARMISAALQH